MLKIFEGKSPNERNKIIAAGALGFMALISLYLAFGRSLIGGPSTTTVKVTASPKPSVTPRSSNTAEVVIPPPSDQDFVRVTTPVVYDPRMNSAPDPGRNIFAFYEPPPPTPYVPTPIPIVPVRTPEPTPTPPILIAVVTPQNVYAGSRSFRLEINGDKFSPDTRIYLSQSQLPTQFISPQRIAAEVPANLIAGEGPRQIIVQSSDGKLYSNQVFLQVQAQPKPQFQYIGMIARKRSNNDTAYFAEAGKNSPTGARLNDIVGGRFRLLSISSDETIFEDVNLGFKHKVQLYRPAPGTSAASGAAPGGFPNGGFPNGGFQNGGFPAPGTPGYQNPTVTQGIPGIPDGVRYAQPNPPGNPDPNTGSKEDVDDNDPNN